MAVAFYVGYQCWKVVDPKLTEGDNFHGLIGALAYIIPTLITLFIVGSLLNEIF